MAEEPCAGWAPDTGTCTGWAEHTQPVKDYALAFATHVIWAATGRRFGLCTRTVRPCGPRNPVLYRTYGVDTYWTLVGVAGGGVVPLWQDGCGCSGGCACEPSSVTLPGPVDSVTSVLLDGVVLAGSEYRLDGDMLVRLNHEAWPVQQDLGLPTTEPDTWSVTYVQGVPVPAVVNNAAGVYACEVAKARTGGTCQLPSRITSISRQGVDVQLLSTEDYLDKGLTGFEQVDQIIRAVNPDGLRARPRVLSLDLPTMR
jgi:hypothetical protein